MKRLLFIAGLIVAIGSIGGNILTANAQSVQTLTPAQTAVLEQELAVAKATLVNLQTEAGMVPTGDSGTASVTATPVAVATPVATPSSNNGLSASEVSAFQGTLSTLAATLSQLNNSLSANATLTLAQKQGVQATLNGMEGTLTAMATSIVNDSNLASAAPATAPIAVNQPAPVVAATPSLSASVGVAPTPANTAAPVAANQPATTPTTNAAPQTAQASSFWSFTKDHWPTIVIVLLVILILAILFWPEKETVKTVSTSNSGSGKPKSAPTANASLSQNTDLNIPRATIITSSSNVPTPATPVANAVAAPSQNNR